MIGLCDGDVALYRAGYAAEKKVKRQLDSGDIEHIREVAPESHAIQNLRTVMESLENKFSKIEVFLSGSNNFRKNVATIKPYKGNRSPFQRPVHYEALRQFLIDKYRATVSDGCEADDDIGIRATDGCDGCIVSTDKDLRQIKGKHYNWVRDEWSEVDEREGLRVFYRQMLTGDATDNIPGIEGVGPVNSSLIVDPFTKEKGMWQAVKAEWHLRYPKGYESGGKVYAVDEVLAELGSLLWIQRTNRIRWEAP